MQKKLKTKNITKVCMGITSVFCSCWKFFRTKTPFRNVDDFDYYIWDLRSTCENELVYNRTVKNLPFFIREKIRDEDCDTNNYNIKIGDMCLQYSLENFKRKPDEIPVHLRQPINCLIKHELLRKTVSSHSAAKTVDLQLYKEQQQRGGHNARLRK